MNNFNSIFGRVIICHLFQLQINVLMVRAMTKTNDFVAVAIWPENI